MYSTMSGQNERMSMTTSSAEPTDLDAPIALIDEATGALRADKKFSPFVSDIGDVELTQFYEDITVVRRIDAEATALQRQGELGLWAPMLGQEAAQVGSAHALRSDDFVFASYREHAVAYLRGVDPAMILRFWRGSTHSGWDPYAINMTTPAIVVGSQMLPAVGYAMGISRDAADSIAITYFGDGATSEGDFSEALGFAASYRAPVVFFCQNNQWAISAPVGVQTTVPISHRALGFGIESVRVDGNDVLAVLAVTRWAAARARTGEGPTLIEAVTYRMGPHTTSDDPTRYRDQAELELWRQRDPLDRIRLVLEFRGILDDALTERVAAKADEYAAAVRAGCLATIEPPPESIFDNVYAEAHSLIEEERAAFIAYESSAS
jgi:2-oxoisovalerate dehydrogenase E1 component alpha subunit